MKSRRGSSARPRGGEEPIERRKLYQEVAERLEGKILSGEFAPGDQLPSERDIMEAYGVGRPSVREALFALKKMGLVSIQSGERARVTAPSSAALVRELSGAARHFLATEAGMREFQQARLIFESGMARLAAEISRANDIEILRQQLAANKRALSDPHRFEQTDIAFHLTIVRMSGNSIFVALHEAIAEWLADQRTTTVRVKGSPQAAVRAHTAIFNAIADHDADAAGKAMEDHLKEVSRYYWAAIEGARPRKRAAE